jgi:hypothetical protein
MFNCIKPSPAFHRMNRPWQPRPSGGHPRAGAFVVASARRGLNRTSGQMRAGDHGQPRLHGAHQGRAMLCAQRTVLCVADGSGALGVLSSNSPSAATGAVSPARRGRTTGVVKSRPCWRHSKRDLKLSRAARPFLSWRWHGACVITRDYPYLPASNEHMRASGPAASTNVG